MSLADSIVRFQVLPERSRTYYSFSISQNFDLSISYPLFTLGYLSSVIGLPSPRYYSTFFYAKVLRLRNCFSIMI